MRLETEGVSLEIDETLKTILGTVVTISGDNLPSHSLGGFRGCFNSGKNVVAIAWLPLKKCHHARTRLRATNIYCDALSQMNYEANPDH
jgi:hypothetical protein